MKALKFMRFAEAAASLSKDPSTKVGAVAIDDCWNVLALGYNGFPRGVVDSEERLCNRETKLLFTSHAEANLVAQSAYLGVSLRGATVIVTSLFPCADCAKLLVQAGVRRIIAPKIANERWAESNAVAKTIFNEAGLEIVELCPQTNDK